MKKTAVIALIIVCLMTLGIVFDEPVRVHAQTSVISSASISVQPNPAKLGQVLDVRSQIEPAPPTSDDTFINLSVTVLRPDGHVETLGPFASSAAGNLSVQYILAMPFFTMPILTGTWTFTVSFPGQTFNHGTLHYMPSENQTTLTVLPASPQSTPSPSPTAAPTPAPTSSAVTVTATADTGSLIDLTIGGNVTSSQMANVTIVANKSATTTAVSFALTGQSGTTGFGNVTIPKSVVPYGTTPTIYIDNQPAQSQGYNQDSTNYYVWYTTHFSTHEVSIVFTASSSIPEFLEDESTTPTEEPFPTSCSMGFVALIILALLGSIVYILKRKW
jgi:hypothetical protein